MRSSSSMIVGQAVQQRGLAGAGAAGDQHVAAAAADDLQDLGAFRRDRAELDQLVERQLVLLELADGERGAVDRQRRHDGVDARAVGEARVADRRGFVDAPADLADDALADIEQLLVVAEADAGALDPAGDFDEHRAGAVDHDVGDVVARQQRLERTVAENVVADVVEQLFLLGDRHHDVLDRDDLVDDVADFLARRLAVELGELGEVDRLDQGAEDRRLDLVVVVRAPRFDGRRGRRRLGGRQRRRGDGRRRSRARETAGAALEAVPARRRRALTARVSLSVPLRLPNTTVLHAGGYFARNFSIRGDRNEPRGFLVSPRPVSRCAICRNISVVR